LDHREAFPVNDYFLFLTHGNYDEEIMPKFITVNDEIIECPRCGSTDFKQDYQTDKKMLIYCLQCETDGVASENNEIVLDKTDPDK
jgi:late competence protein required for DNA uptake (superfamily II DNA/RNA helicase)